MDYISTQEAAEQWGVSLRQVQRLLRDGRIDGARKYGISWMIPADAKKPTLSPEERGTAETGKPRKQNAPAVSFCAAYPALYLHGGNLTGAYKRCQSEEERQLLSAWLVCYRGDAQKAGETAATILAATKKPLVKLGCGILLSIAALYAGDAAAWRAAVKQMETTRVPASWKHEKELAIACAYISLEGRDVYPLWLEIGALGVIDPELLPSAYQIYARLLYIKYKEIDLLAVAEPLIAACAGAKSDINEIYLHLLAAIAYHNKGSRLHAREHIAKAIALAKPLGLIAPFIEYRHVVAVPMDACLQEKWEEALPEIKRRMQPFMASWARVYTDVWGKPFTEALTQREYEISLLASRGLSLADIAARTDLSQNSVKKYLNAAYQKLGVEKRASFAPSSTIRKGCRSPQKSFPRQRRVNDAV